MRGEKRVFIRSHDTGFRELMNMAEMRDILVHDCEAGHLYKDGGEYHAMTKVMDVFGNDTDRVVGVGVK